MTRIKIGPRRWSLSFEPNLKDVNGKLMDGLCEHASLRLRVRRELGAYERASTTLHEILHVIDDNYGLGLGERRILALEATLTALFSENRKWASEWLQQLSP
jgi:hypothetical protein